MSIDGNVWKNYSKYVSKETEAINKECNDALEEAKLAYAETASKSQTDGNQKILDTLEKQGLS